MQDDDDASARLQTVNEAFEDSAPLGDVLLAVCREFGLAHAARCLDPTAAAEDTDMAGASSASTGHSDGDDDAEESDGEEDDTWSAAERDDKDLIVSPCSSPHMLTDHMFSPVRLNSNRPGRSQETAVCGIHLHLRADASLNPVSILRRPFYRSCACVYS